MAHNQACPHCGAIVALPDEQSGRAVRCIHCQVIFLAADFAPAPPLPSAAPLEPPRALPVYYPPEPPLIQLSAKARRNLIYAGIGLLALLLAAIALYGVVSLAGHSQGSGTASVVVATPKIQPAAVVQAIPKPPPSQGPIMTSPGESAATPTTTPAPPPPTLAEVYATLTDEQVGAALHRGSDLLVRQFDHGAIGLTVAQRAQYGPGVDALCAYALLHAGEALNDPEFLSRSTFMSEVLDHLRGLEITPQITQFCTYAHSLRISALTLAGRNEDRATVDADLQWLISKDISGGYTYNDPNGAGPDCSNSQYGLLGVWAAADAGYAVPAEYWERVQQFWIAVQHPDGGWSYGGGSGAGKISMTSAGIVSLFVTHDYLEPPKIGAVVGREPFSPELKKGLDFFDAHENDLLGIQSPFDGYGVYGIERAGLASGFKYFGKTDWYRRLASEIIVNRLPGAIQSGNLIDTAFYMLFLSRGRHPLIMNKLRYDGDWANRPRDIARLARYASHDLERTLNWEVEPVDLPWNEWFDAPVLELSGSGQPALTDEQIDNLRQYILNGGLLFTNSDGGSKTFDAYVHSLAAKLFPQYPLRDVPADHPFFNIEYHIDHPPRLQYVTNGVRTLIVHSPMDLTQYWQVRTDLKSDSAMQLGINFFVTAAGKSDYRNHLDTLYIPPAVQPAKEKMLIAQLSYNGNCNPEPAALTRFGRLLQRDFDIGIETIPTPILSLKPGAAPLAILTGTEAIDFSLDEATAMRAYVEAGGVLLIDPAGGSRPFYDHFLDPDRALCFPGGKFESIPSNHPLLDGSLPGSHAIVTLRVRSAVVEKPETVNPHLQFFRYGKGVVILAPLDLQSGLLGTNTWGIAGYTSEYSQSFMINLMLWIRSGAHDAESQN